MSCFWRIVKNTIRILLLCPHLLHERTQNMNSDSGNTTLESLHQTLRSYLQKKKIYLETAPFSISSVGDKKNKSLTWVPGSRADAAVKFRSTRSGWTVLSCTPRKSMPYPLPGRALGSYLQCQGKHVLTCLWRKGASTEANEKKGDEKYEAAFAPMSCDEQALHVIHFLAQRPWRGKAGARQFPQLYHLSPQEVWCQFLRHRALG